MEGFTYTDIFDTKGIEYIIIIAFLLLIIPFMWLLNRPLKAEVLAKNSQGVISENALNILHGLFYGKNHTWAHLEKSGHARIGLNELLLYITGNVRIEYIAEPGENINRGDLLAILQQNGKQLKIVSPLSGKIQSVNDKLKTDPESLNLDPYGKGWVARIIPGNWSAETKDYYLAGDAEEWTRKEMSRIKDFVIHSQKKHAPESTELILQEGGELKACPLLEMDSDVWEDFQEQFLKDV